MVPVADRDQRLREFILRTTDYWMHVIEWRAGEGMKVVLIPSTFARNYRMLAHFRALDRDDD